MHKRRTWMIALSISLLAVLGPILAALYVAEHEGMKEASSDALTLATEAQRRGDVIAFDADKALTRLSTRFASAPCSDAAIAAMRDLSLDAAYVSVLGHVNGSRLVCSSLGRHGAGIALGPFAYSTSRAVGIRPSVQLGLATQRPFLGLERDGFLALFHRDVATDVFLGWPDIALGAYVPGKEAHMVGRGAFSRAWLTRLGEASQVTFSEGGHVVGIRRSARYDFATYAAIPSARLQTRVRRLATILLPIGLGLGAGVAWVIVYLARQRTSFPALLRAALKNREFVLYYQPIVELASGRTVGMEALLRWPSEDGRSGRPDLFIPAAEDCGLIQLTRYVLVQVATDGPEFFRCNSDCYISVNLSATDLQSNDIVDLLRRLIDTPGIRPHNIIAELTEHSFVDPFSAKNIVNQIRALGIRVAIDDFGTGYSSLSHLAGLKIDYLKIDKVFVEAVGTDAATSEVALHIVRVARSLGLAIIAEGVENEVQAGFLAGMASSTDRVGYSANRCR